VVERNLEEGKENGTKVAQEFINRRSSKTVTVSSIGRGC
jgi:hypothetical protein